MATTTVPDVKLTTASPSSTPDRTHSAADAASPDLLAHLDHLANPESPASLVPQVCLVCLASPHSRHASPSLRHHVNHALLDLPDHQDLPAALATPEMLASQERQERTPHPASLVLRDLPDLPEKLDHQARPETRVRQPRTSLCNPESPESLETQDRKDLPARPEHQAKTASPAHLAPRARRVLLAHQAPTASQAHKDLPARPETRARRVSARNTARSTAASSSRTAHGDKCKLHAHATQ
jgi:FtsZ-interacting cell division protein ZipA